MRAVADIVRMAQVLRSRYGDRDARYQNAYSAYKGEYDKIMGSPYHSINHKDARYSESQTVQVWNLIKPIVDAHRLLINKLPGIRVPATEYGRPEEAGKAERLERMYYALWDASQMGRRHGEAAFDLSLNAATVWMTRWDNELDHPVIVGRSPGTCYPVPKRRGDALAAVFFIWDVYLDELIEQIPEAKSLLGTQDVRGSDRKVEVIEYIDETDYVLVVNNQGKSISPSGGPHKMSAVPVCITAGMAIRDELFPPGPIDQVIAVNDHLNRFQTKWGVALEDVLFGRWSVEGPNANEVVLNNTPGGITRIPFDDTHLQYNQPQAPPREVFAELQQIQAFMRTHTNWPTSASGEMEGSVITGKAVSRLQGVLSALAAEADDNLGRDLARCNGWAAEMMESYYPKKTFTLYSGSPVTAKSAPGRKYGFKVEIIPERDIQGYYRNELVYSPFGTDMSAALSIGMQAVESDIFSRRYLRDLWPGIGDAEAMAKEIMGEKEEKIDFELRMQQKAQQMAQEAMQQQAAPQGPPVEGGAGVPPGPAPPASGPGAPPSPGPEAGGMPLGGGSQMPPGGPVVMPAGQPSLIGMGEPLTGRAGMPLPYDNVKPYKAALDQLMPQQEQGGAKSELGPNAVSADEVVEALSAVPKLKGQVYLIGEIAQRGATENFIELGLTDKLDKATVLNAVPQWNGRIRFTILSPDAIPSTAIPVSGEAPEPVEAAPMMEPEEMMPSVVPV